MHVLCTDFRLFRRRKHLEIESTTSTPFVRGATAFMETSCLRIPARFDENDATFATTFLTRPVVFPFALSPWKLHEFTGRARDSKKSLALAPVPLTGFAIRDRTNRAILQRRARLLPSIRMSLNTNGPFTFSNLIPLANDSPGDEEYRNVPERFIASTISV